MGAHVILQLWISFCCKNVFQLHNLCTFIFYSTEILFTLHALSSYIGVDVISSMPCPVQYCAPIIWANDFTTVLPALHNLEALMYVGPLGITWLLAQ